MITPRRWRSTSTSAASTSPWAPLNSMYAFAFVLTLFDATIAPPERPVACAAEPMAMSTAASATFSLPTTAMICAACDGGHRRLPDA